jgi:hypothetical protein
VKEKNKKAEKDGHWSNQTTLHYKEQQIGGR